MPARSTPRSAPRGGRPLRADAARNRDRLLAAASDVLTERGLDAPLEEIARRAGVSIGTLYNHFPSRDAFLAAIFPDRLTAVERLADTALADDDPWQGFVVFVTGVFDLQAHDQGLNDALSQRLPVPPDVRAACDRGFRHLEAILRRAKKAGALRPDFTAADLAVLICTMSPLIRETRDTAPDAWRRCLAFHIDGLRTGAAHPIDVPPLTADELARILPGRAE
jgi:AcrR family transcriptional regulator